MRRSLLRRTPRRGIPNLAILGVMISIALLVTWTFVGKLEGGGRPESLLLEFLTTFIVVCGALIVTSAVVGLLPFTARRRNR